MYPNSFVSTLDGHLFWIFDNFLQRVMLQTILYMSLGTFMHESKTC